MNLYFKNKLLGCLEIKAEEEILEAQQDSSSLTHLPLQGPSQCYATRIIDAQ
jgi:hypothetical protein